MSKRTKLNTIRIVAGRWRGRRLGVPDLKGLRPTTNRVRETLFNWLMHDIAGARCLDLFAGSGALGLEAISRGAKTVELVESSSLAVKNLRNSILELSDEFATDSINVMHAHALDYLSNSPSEPFDIVFLDPPFNSGLLRPSIELLIRENWLSTNSMVYIERQHSPTSSKLSVPWTLFRHGKAGQCTYYLYQT